MKPIERTPRSCDRIAPTWYPSAPVCAPGSHTHRIAVSVARSDLEPGRRRNLGPANPDPESPALLGRAGLRHPAAPRSRGRRGHHAPRDLSPGARSRALSGRLCPAVPPPGRCPLRRESVPARPASPAPGHPQTVARRCPGSLPPLARSAGNRPGGARYPVRRRQLGVAHPRRLGRRVAGAARRHGSHAVHVLPTGRRDRTRTDLGRTHLWSRADRHVPRPQGLDLRHRVGWGRVLRQDPTHGRTRVLDLWFRGRRCRDAPASPR